MSYEFELIDDQPSFSRAVEEILGESRIGLDLESNGFFRYPERVCLVQVSTRSAAFLIDPLAICDLSALGRILADPGVETVLHSGSYDIVSLDRDWGFRARSLFDTQIAASFIGIERLGLASVLESVLGVEIVKEKRLQRSDWTRRPLSREALSYAAGDVRHLLDLREALAEKLRRMGRLEWVEEECQRLADVRYDKPDPDMAVFGVKGWRNLDGRGLAILKELVDYREDHAIRLGRPHFRVIPDMALIALATKPSSDLRRVRGLGGFARGGLASGLRDAIARGKSARPPRRPPQPGIQRLSRADSSAAGERLARLKAWRLELGKRLSLDPSLLWNMSSLQRLARRPDSLREEMRSPDVRKWQRAEFGESIRKALG